MPKAAVRLRKTKINDLMRARGWSQSDLADAVGVGRERVNRALAGEPISGGFVAGLMLAFPNFTPDELFEAVPLGDSPDDTDGAVA